MDLVGMITVIGCCFALLSVIVTMFIFLANKIDNLRTDIQKESKDFHGRLCSIEQKIK